MITYTDVINADHEPHMYRLFIAKKYGAILAHGNLGDSYEAAMRHVRRLAKITGFTEEYIRTRALDDYENLDNR